MHSPQGVLFLEDLMKDEPSPGDRSIRVLVADSNQIHTQLLAEALKRDSSLHVIAAASDAAGLVSLADRHDLDVVVISSNLDGEPERGFAVLRELRAAHPEAQAVMLVDSSKRAVVLEAFRAGARGVFSRNGSLETLSKCVRSVYDGQVWANSEQMRFALEALASAPTVRAVDAKGFDLLSKRELEVVQSLAEGLTNREIAERLGLSQHTIKNYVFRVFDKLGVSNRIELLFLTLSKASSPATHAPANGNIGHGPVAYWQQAAKEGSLTAQITLAEMYACGKGVETDRVSAYTWYLIANEQLLRARKHLTKLMTMEQLIEAERGAAECLSLLSSPLPPAHQEKTDYAHAILPNKSA
jgi:DNA-binding NarL/FixJ family response regulator